MKYYLLIVLILVVILATILLRTPYRSVPLNEAETVRAKASKEDSQPKPENTTTVSKSSTPDSLPKVRITAVDYKIDPLAFNRERENPPFEFRGGAGTGRVFDRHGNVILESGEEIGIFEAIVGPDNEKVLVRGGDSGNLVLVPSTKGKIRLPPYPPEANVLFIGDWHWIGPNLLWGTSGVEKLSHEGPHENCSNENNVAQTKFYTFDLLTEQLSEVVMPTSVTQPLVNAVEVKSDGHIHLRHDESEEGAEQDLGWFKVDAAK